MREFRLTVRPQIFIAETARQLKVSLQAADHQQLFEELRRLGQRVKILRMDTAGDEIIARPFGRACGQHGRFHLHKPARIEKLPHALKNTMPQQQIILHRRTADIQIPVLHAQILGNIFRARGFPARHHRLVGDDKRQRIGFGKNRHPVDKNFQLSRFDVWIFRAFHSFSGRARYRNTVFGTQRCRSLTDSRRCDIRTENNLDNAAAVAQMNKQQAAVIAVGVHPAAKLNGPADILLRKFAAKNTLGIIHKTSPLYENKNAKLFIEQFCAAEHTKTVPMFQGIKQTILRYPDQNTDIDNWDFYR